MDLLPERGARDVLHDETVCVLYRLDGTSPQVWRESDVFHADERIALVDRLDLHHVQTGTENLLGAQHLDERLLVHHRPAAGVDQYGARLHQGELALRHHAPRRRVERHVQGHHIARLQQRVEIDPAGVRRLLALLIASVLALAPAPARAGSAWGSPPYGAPPGWCTPLSDKWVGPVKTTDPLVASNPERDTFYGFHRNPGYDDWYGFFYGDFRGTPGDSSGWVKLLHEDYPNHYHWNFADARWAVHGHAKTSPSTSRGPSRPPPGSLSRRGETV